MSVVVAGMCQCCIPVPYCGPSGRERERRVVWFEWGVSAGKGEGAACGVTELVDGEVPW